VRPGDLFVALPGISVDGHTFIPQAIRQGAVAVAGTQELVGLPVPYLWVPESRAALAYLSAALHGFPARRLTVIGITGTDGKTTTANLLYHILRAAGLRTGMISTVNALIGDQALDTGFHVTTPEAPDVQRYLAQMVAAGLTHVILEATSHGLASHRVTACDFDLALVTNITHEHLDFHGSLVAYRQAKMRLFHMLAATPPKETRPPRGAVLNRDDSSYEYLAPIVQTIPQVSYGLHLAADLRPDALEQSPAGMYFTARLALPGREPLAFPLQTPLVGLYNLSNCLAAVAAAVGVLKLPPEAARLGLAAFPGVPGRMERLDLGQDFTAVVDFAHTPNALRNALEAARRLVEPPGRVIALFGSAGLRDRQKRSLMAQAAAELADLTVLTAEDPRTESLEVILDEMATAMRGCGVEEGRGFWCIPDRGQALRFAVHLARPGDILLACGKGHEQSMCFGVTEYPWDDRIALRAALSELLGIPGPAMPRLPTSP
jgi:UDP-N-acetylmuramoyl-L-alanyl-D-glutamate--2,6-diaminopimelate ligase